MIQINIPANVGDRIYLVKHINNVNYVYELLVASLVITDKLKIKACDKFCGGYTFSWDDFDKIVFETLEDAVNKVKMGKEHGKLIIVHFGKYDIESDF